MTRELMGDEKVCSGLAIDHKYPQLFDPGWMFELLNRLGLNLPDTFPSHGKTSSDFLKGVVTIQIDPITHSQDLGLPW